MSNLQIYEINTATWLYRLGQEAGRLINLADVPDKEWDRLSSYGCQAVWLMGIWQRSPVARQINLKDTEFMTAMTDVLPDLEADKDLIGSAYSIQDYVVSQTFGGNQALARARQQLKQRGIKLILDFVPNHVALDHPWVSQHPEYFVQGSSHELEVDPASYVQVGDKILARGRDPEFEAWSDVLQLNVFAPELREQTKQLLDNIASLCDGVRCDMAMLLLSDIFAKTWQDKVGPPLSTEFWTELISATRQNNPDFIFMAEAYWDRQAELLQLGFDYCYDKDLYDHMIDNQTDKLKQKISSPLVSELVHFLENHDEPRAAQTFDWLRHQAAAMLINSLPGAIIYYEGQFEGLQMRTPVQLGRDLEQTSQSDVEEFYLTLLNVYNPLRLAMSGWRIMQLKAYELNKKPCKNLLATSWQAADHSYICLINWCDKELQTQLEVQTQPQIKLYSGEQRPYLKLSDGQLNCQLKAWQACLIEF